MVHIAQGNQRQYFSQAVEQPQNLGAVVSSLTDGVNQGISIVQKANESNLANNQVQLATDFMAKNNEINTKYQADPTNPERERELRESFEELAGKYKINPVCQGQWTQIKDNVYNNYKRYNAQWQLKQQQTNATNDLKNGYESLTNQVSMMGMNGAGVDEIRLVYKNGIDGLSKGATAVLGSEVAEQFLKDSNHDIMTTYISALAVNNPLVAQQLMKDEGVINDIGKAETIEKLNNYIANSLTNQNKKVAVEELGNTLRAMKSDEAKNILEGRANLNQVTKFIEQHKSLPEGSKDLILDIYGIGSKGDYYYDKQKQIITKSEKGAGGSGRSSASGSLVPLSKLSKEQKDEIAVGIESNLNKMFFFDETDMKPVSAKNGKKNNNQSAMVQRMGNLATMQGMLDTAWKSGIINKSQRQQYMNKFIEPMSNYMEANLSALDEKSWGQKKLGYGNLVNAFNVSQVKGKNNKLAVQKDLLTAQGYYYSALDTARKKLNLSSIYDLEKLSSADQKRIYKKASDEAIAYAKKNSEHPEVFFNAEYPQLYTLGVQAFGFKDGNIVARKVAKRIYSAEDMNKVDVNKIMSEELGKTKAIKQQQAKDLIESVKAVNYKHQAKYNEGVLSDWEIEQRANQLGITKSQLTNDAYSKRLSPQMYLIYLEEMKRQQRK